MAEGEGNFNVQHSQLNLATATSLGKVAPSQSLMELNREPSMINVPRRPVLAPVGSKKVAPQTAVPSRSKVVRVPKGYQLASFNEANQYLQTQSYMKKTVNPTNGVEEYTRLELLGSNDEMKQYGLGMYLYFEFLKRLIICFLLMSAILAISLIVNYQGSGLSAYSPSFTLTLATLSLGNLKAGDRESYLIVTVCDVLSMLVFFIFYLNWRCFHDDAVRSMESDKEVVNPISYAVTVYGLNPEDSSPGLQKELKSHIDTICKGGGAYEVEVVYNYFGNFQKFVEYEEIIEKVEKERQVILQSQKNPERLRELQKDLNQIETQLLNLTSIFKPMYAVIHFETLQAKIAFINISRKYHMINTFPDALARCLCCSQHMPANYQFQGKYPLILDTNTLSRPEEINWENVSLSQCFTATRLIFSVVLMIISIAVTSSLIVMSTLYVSSTSSCSSYNVSTTLAQAIAGDSKLLYCFCSANIAQIYTNTQVGVACSDITNSILISNVLQIAASLVSTISNVFLTIIVSLIARRILRPNTIPKQYSFIFVGVFVSNFLNSIIMPLVLNGNIFGVESVNYIKFLSFINFSQLSVFSDFTSDWYALISPYYLNIILIGIVTPFISFLISSLSYCWLQYSLRRACESNDKDDPLIQKEANSRISSFEFSFAQQQSQLVLYVFLAVMYSGLIPLMIPAATLGLIMCYICKKAVVVRYCIRVPANQNLDQKTLLILPFMILIHALFSVWSHTSSNIFQNGSSIFSVSLTLLGGTLDRVFSDVVILGELGLILVFIVLDYTVLKIIGSLRECCKDELEVPPELASIQNAKYSTRISKQNILGSFKLINSRVYGHAKKAYLELISRKANFEKDMENEHNPQNFD